MLSWVLLVLAFYLFLVAIFPYFFIPHFGILQSEVPKEIPLSMRAKIKELKNRAHSVRDFLRLAYEFLGSKYRSERNIKYLSDFFHFFTPLRKIWHRQGYIPCTKSGYLLKIFLIKSGFFKEKDIRVRHSFIHVIFHHYLQVRLGNKWVDVDVGEKQHGVPFKKHLQFFQD